MYSIKFMCLKSGDVVGERYKIIDQLGRGGFGTTYRAEDNDCSANSPPIVVIKEISTSRNSDREAFRESEYIRRLELEANTLRNLEHPCIPRFFDSFTENNYYYIVMEYIEGHDLKQEIIAGQPIEEAAAVSILQEILEILQFVHQNNIIHRDIKPSNIIRRRSDNRLILIDFGAVKEVATEHTNAAGRILTAIFYTPGYTPNEQLAGKPGFGSDIYALGITTMQGVTGFAIEAIKNSEKIPRRDGQCNFTWEEYAPQIAPEFKRIISRMIECYSENRYQNVKEVIHDLELAINTLEVSKHDNSLIEPEPVPIPGDEEDHNSDEPQPSVSFVEDILLTLRQFYARHRRKIIFIAIVIAAYLSVLLFGGVFSNSNVCALNIEDNISCGEEILDPLSKGSIRLRAAKSYHERQYLDALETYQESWQKERKDAETLIYLNNALLDAYDINAVKIAVAVPLSSNETNEIKSSSLAQDFLRGVAQAQTEVNLGLSQSSRNIRNKLSQFNFLTHREIASGKKRGLKVIIADDGNNSEQAERVAMEIAEDSSLLGVVGHYTSKMSLDTKDIYRQQNLPLISYGSTSNYLSEVSTAKQRNNFFRVVYTTTEEADVLVRYIEQKALPEKKIAIFYNPEDDYSNNFKIAIIDRIRNSNDPNISIIDDNFNIADESNFSTSIALKKINNLGVNICILIPDGQLSNSLAKARNILRDDNGERLMLGGNPLVNSQIKQLKTSQPLDLVVSTFWHPTANPDSKFNQQTEQLWESSVNGGTAMAYDATLTMIEAIERQTKPTRKGTIQQLSAEKFSVSDDTATGEIFFKSQNGDRKDFDPTLVRLVACESGNRFVDDNKAKTLDLACQN